jgi:hypothetical protein
MEKVKRLQPCGQPGAEFVLQSTAARLLSMAFEARRFLAL